MMSELVEGSAWMKPPVDGPADGVIGAAAGSLFVFKGAYRAVLISYPSQAQKDEIIRSALQAATDRAVN